jgi:serine/threonine-protein kinase
VAGFRIEAVIGHGSTGTVYSAQDVALQRRVALKILLPELARDARFHERFLRESRLAAALEHPHIVPIHGVGESDGVLFLAMRYVGNGDLARLLERVGRLDPDRALLICSHVAGALDAAHAHDLIHRDVKPGNVLLGRDGDHDYAYLCDFGLAKLGTSVTSLSGARDIIGTVGYLSPEQIDGLPVDGRTDVYALGCVLFECLAGEPPFVRENELATILAHRSEPPPAVSDRRPELPEALDAVVARALAKDREGRYATCGELVRDARRALEGQPVAAPPSPAKTGPAVLTFVFADIRGYTAYMREHGDEAGARMAQQFAAIVEPLAQAHGGTAPRLHGDEALVIFDSARAALRYAVALRQQVEQDGLPCGVGIGVDAGEAVVGEQDLHGGGLNRAARLCARAKAGEILATDGVVHLAGRFDEARYGLRRLERVKGFEQPIGATEVHPAGTQPRHEHRRRLAGLLRGRRPRLRLGVAAVAVAVAAGAALVALTGGGGGAHAPPFEANSIAVLDAASGAPVGTVAPGLRICVFAAAGSDLWACDADQSIVLRVDARRRRVVDQVPLPTYHGSFAVGFGSIWVGDIASPTIRKVSVRYRTSSAPIRLPDVPAMASGGEPQNVNGMVVTDDAVWAAYGFPKRIAKIDPASGKVLFSRPMRQDCPCDVQLAWGDGKLWAVGGDGAHIYRIDPATGRPSATGRLHHGSVTGAVVAGGYLWVAMQEDGGVWKIDDSGTSIDKVPTGRGPASLAAADGRVWVANADDGTVTAIDPGSGATRDYQVGHRPLAVAELGGKVFVGLGQSTAEAAAGVSGEKVVRAVAPDLAFEADPVSLRSPNAPVGRAGGAGLMAAVTDAHGATTIAPELAREAPTVSSDGRTYRFRLRPGLRFSSGEPVTAEAVRYSIERAVAPGLVNHYCRDLVLNDVAGEEAYESGRTERIAGIQAEGDAVSITLTRPSPTLPARLTNPCLSVVPPGTPTVPVGLQRPIPSAGPYYVSSFILGQQTILRRNPEYGGPRPQPLDALVLRSGIAPEAAGTLVERGQADFAADAEGSPAFAPGGRYEQRFGRPGAELRYVRPPSIFTGLILFDTRQGIFRAARLRRAANLALDRTALGGDDGGEARTLLIPPGVPGHRDAQAYPLRGDLRRARALAAGLGGAAVLAVPPEPPQLRQVAEQVARRLARIGITMSVRVLADPTAAAADARHPVDAVLTGWGPDYPDPFGSVNVILEPGARVRDFPDFFGDPRWVRRMRQAAAAPLDQRDAVYARLDAALARGPAPFAVLGGPPGVPQLLSARLGCERYFFGTLDLSALCISGE